MGLFCRWRLIVAYGLQFVRERIASCESVRWTLRAETVFSLDDLKKEQGWAEYLKGIAYILQAEGCELSGWEGVMMGDVPRGSGLSSSAAVEMATARVFASVSNLKWDAAYMARIGQRAENEWVGVNCGIMDQMASAACKEGHALFLDCRSLKIQHVPLPDRCRDRCDGYIHAARAGGFSL